MEKKAVYGNERRRTFNDILDHNVPDDAVCTVGDIMKFTGLTHQGVLRWRRMGRIPQPLDLPNMGPTTPRLWRVGDIRDWARKIGLLKDGVAPSAEVLPEEPQKDGNPEAV